MTHPTPHRLTLICLNLATVVTVAGLSGCSGHSNPTPTTTASSSPPAPTVPATTTVEPTDPVPPPLDDDGPTSNPHAAAPSHTLTDQARVRGTAFLRAFARTDLPQQQWWAGVSGYFTPAALAAYEGTDVANVPVHKITEGSAKLVRGSTKYRAQVTVKTDIGVYVVTLIRADNEWLVDRSTPPKGTR